jgi:hypothetical protein
MSPYYEFTAAIAFMSLLGGFVMGAMVVAVGFRRKLAAAEQERDMFKGECASISAEFGLPPTIRPAEGEISRMRREWMELRAAARTPKGDSND